MNCLNLPKNIRILDIVGDLDLGTSDDVFILTIEGHPLMEIEEGEEIPLIDPIITKQSEFVWDWRQTTL